MVYREAEVPPENANAKIIAEPSWYMARGNYEKEAKREFKGV